MSAFLEVHDLQKSFTGTCALGGANLIVGDGEVHGLVGPNGAGKSTLIKVLAGVHRPDGGVIRIAGEPVKLTSTDDARRHGLGFIHQEPQLVGRLSVLENITLGVPRDRRAGCLLDWRSIRRQAQVAADRVGLDASLSEPVQDLGPAQQGLVAIARALLLDARLLVLDEPTAMLTDQEILRLNAVIADLSERGTAVLYVSHRLDEIFNVTARVTVMRDGRDVAVRDTATLAGQDELVTLIAGHRVGRTTATPTDSTAPVVLSVRHLQGPGVRDASFDLHRGEVLGVTGLVGAGRTELAMLMFGAVRATAGQMLLDGGEYRPRTPREALDSGVALLPEDRRADGAVMTMSVRSNLTLSSLRPLRRVSWAPLIGSRRERRITDELIDRLQVKAPDPDGELATLSGGNQQKVMVGRSMHSEARVLIFDEPTQGVDVRSRAEIYRLVGQLAARGCAVIVVSSDLNEVIELCTRTLVMREGRVVADLRDFDEAYLLSASYGNNVGRSTATATEGDSTICTRTTSTLPTAHGCTTSSAGLDRRSS